MKKHWNLKMSKALLFTFLNFRNNQTTFNSLPFMDILPQIFKSSPTFYKTFCNAMKPKDIYGRYGTAWTTCSSHHDVAFCWCQCLFVRLINLISLTQLSGWLWALVLVRPVQRSVNRTLVQGEVPKWPLLHCCCGLEWTAVKLWMQDMLQDHHWDTVFLVIPSAMMSKK